MDNFVWTIQPKAQAQGEGQHTFIPCGGKSIPCGNSGNMPGGTAHVYLLGVATHVYPLWGKFIGRPFPCGSSGNTTKCVFSCIPGNNCPKFGVTYILAFNHSPLVIGVFCLKYIYCTRSPIDGYSYTEYIL